MRYIKELSEEEKQELEHGYQYGEKHYFRVKCKSILLSNEGKTITEISLLADKTTRTIRSWFNDYEKMGLKKLLIKEGRGIKAPLDSLSEGQVKLIKREIKKNYQSLKTVGAILSKEFDFEVTNWMLKRFIKKNLIILGEESEEA